MEVLLSADGGTFPPSYSFADENLKYLQLLSLEEPWTLILDDALANSFIAPVTNDIKDDHQLTCKLFFVPSKAALLLLYD